MVSVLTPRRFDLLREVHAHPAKDVRALSNTLARDYKNVHADVTALVRAGLLSRDEQGVQAPYDVITAEMRLQVRARNKVHERRESPFVFS